MIAGVRAWTSQLYAKLTTVNQVERTPETSGLKPRQIATGRKALRILGLDEGQGLNKHQVHLFLYVVGLNPTDDIIDSKLRSLKLLDLADEHDAPFTFGHVCHVWNSMLQDLTDEEEILRRAFAFFDKDGNGELCLLELQTTMQELGGLLSDEEIQAFMDAMDMNQDGVIGFDEFITTLRTQMPEMELVRDGERDEDGSPGGSGGGGIFGEVEDEYCVDGGRRGSECSGSGIGATPLGGPEGKRAGASAQQQQQQQQDENNVLVPAGVAPRGDSVLIPAGVPPRGDTAGDGASADERPGRSATAGGGASVDEDAHGFSGAGSSAPRGNVFRDGGGGGSGRMAASLQEAPAALGSSEHGSDGGSGEARHAAGDGSVPARAGDSVPDGVGDYVLAGVGDSVPAGAGGSEDMAAMAPAAAEAAAVASEGAGAAAGTGGAFEPVDPLHGEARGGSGDGVRAPPGPVGEAIVLEGWGSRAAGTPLPQDGMSVPRAAAAKLTAGCLGVSHAENQSSSSRAAVPGSSSAVVGSMKAAAVLGSSSAVVSSTRAAAAAAWGRVMPSAARGSEHGGRGSSGAGTQLPSVGMASGR